MGKTVLLCVELEFQSSKPAFTWALQNLVHEDDQLHIATVLPPKGASAPGSPMAAAAGMNFDVSVDAGKRQQKRQHQLAVDALTQAAKEAIGTKLRYRNIVTVALTSHSSENPAIQLVRYATAKEVDVAVLGSRGFGSFKRSLLSCVGLGSVSDHCLQHLRCPILVVKQQFVNLSSAAAHPQPLQGHQVVNISLPPLEEDGHKRKICIACDSFEHSEAMVLWAMRQVLRETDEIHFVSVAEFINYPVVADGMPPHMYRVELEKFKAMKEAAVQTAMEVASSYVELLEGEQQSSLIKCIARAWPQLWMEGKELLSLYADTCRRAITIFFSLATEAWTGLNGQWPAGLGSAA
eukprot:CAMPEP_0117655224 /NCGR_PEP_ID=MMETSP0804-20121206/4167_1 /TAXON_ID=1074897 /ORGANISM="Tetraselmis astigmatica, Strain CCMP880" /LENGTH=349 /DNA_ID=CAMNT_0005461565 /DNA_START=326 /DNA_END=1376 /DNA_ORIENTATION=+